MYLFSGLIILQVLSMSLSFDVELQGVLKLGDDFLTGLGKSPTKEKMKPHGIYTRAKGKLPKKFSRSSIIRAASVWKNRSDDLFKYVDHIKSKGAKLLKDIGKQIMKDLELEQNFTGYINNITEEYMLTMQNYSEFITVKKTEFVIDEEFTFLDMVETACRLIYRDQKKILNNAIITTSSNNGATEQNLVTKTNMAQIQKINQNLYRQSIKSKREEMRYVCYKFEICRSYPAFTDYVADFIVEIRRLPDDKLQSFIKLLVFLVKVNSDFFKTICHNEDRDAIAHKMMSIFSNVYSIHDTLSVIRAVLTQRFKIIHSSDLKVKMKTNGVRIILDIINKAFEYEHDDILAMEFDTNVKALRSWVANERIFPETLVTKLFNNIINILDYNLSKNAKKEISVLVEMIMKGSSKEEEMAKYLFRDGSKYVRGEDFHNALEII